MVNFPLPIKHQIADNLTLPSKILQFGDGYEQLRSDGLNQSIEAWDIEVVIADAATSAVFQSFLIEHGQHKSFKWQSPRDSSPQDYLIVGKVSGFKRNGGGKLPVFFTRQLKFQLAKKASISATVYPANTTFYFDPKLRFSVNNPAVTFSF